MKGNNLSQAVFFETAEDRLEALLLLLGVQSQKVGTPAHHDWSKPPVLIDFNDQAKTALKPQEGEGVGVEAKESTAEELTVKAAALHTQALRDVLQDMKLLPVENMESFLSFSSMRLMIVKIQDVKTSDECDALQADFDDQKKQMKQLVDSVSTARKDLGRENLKRDKEKKKEEEDKKKKDEDQQKKEAAEGVEKQKNQKFRAERDASLFNLDWSAHEPIKVFEQVRADDHPASQPFILSKPDWAPEKNKMLDAWTEQFPSSREASSLGRTQAPVEASHKLVDEHARLATVPLPPELLLDGPHPALMSATGSSFFYGMSDKTGIVEYEPDFLGSVRVMYKGGFSKILLFEASDLYKVVPKEAKIGSHCDYMKLYVSSKWKNADKNISATLLEKGVKAYVGELKERQVLCIPPGFLVALATEEKLPASGIRRSYLSIDAATVKNFEALIESGVLALGAMKDLVASKLPTES